MEEGREVSPQGLVLRVNRPLTGTRRQTPSNRSISLVMKGFPVRVRASASLDQALCGLSPLVGTGRVSSPRDNRPEATPRGRGAALAAPRALSASSLALRQSLDDHIAEEREAAIGVWMRPVLGRDRLTKELSGRRIEGVVEADEAGIA
jgi:hypothetical protein